MCLFLFNSIVCLRLASTYSVLRSLQSIHSVRSPRIHASIKHIVVSSELRFGFDIRFLCCCFCCFFGLRLICVWMCWGAHSRFKNNKKNLFIRKYTLIWMCMPIAFLFRVFVDFASELLALLAISIARAPHTNARCMNTCTWMREDEAKAAAKKKKKTTSTTATHTVYSTSSVQCV